MGLVDASQGERQDLGGGRGEQADPQHSGDLAPAALQCLHGFGLRGQDPLGVPGRRPPGAGQLDPPAHPPQQFHAGGLLQCGDLLGDPARGVAEGLGHRGDGAAPGQLDVCAGEFERTGVTDALNRYRNMDRDWEDLAVFGGAPVIRPAPVFVGGTSGRLHDVAGRRDQDVSRHATGLVVSPLLDGCGHWIRQERPAEIDRLLTDRLAALL